MAVVDGWNRPKGFMGCPEKVAEAKANRRALNSAQAPPMPNERPAVWDMVIADMRERDASGLAKYGTRLQPGNGRDALVDAYQEALDLVAYLRQAIAERAV